MSPRSILNLPLNVSEQPAGGPLSGTMVNDVDEGSAGETAVVDDFVDAEEPPVTWVDRLLKSGFSQLSGTWSISEVEKAIPGVTSFTTSR